MQMARYEASDSHRPLMHACIFCRTTQTLLVVFFTHPLLLMLRSFSVEMLQV